jgi:hypothetical protein
VPALGIRVARLRRRLVVRRSHASPGSPGAPQSNDVRRAVMKAFLLEEPDARWPSLATGRAVAVNAMTAHLRGIARRPRTVRSNSVRTGMHLPPQWEYSPQYSHNCVVV